MLEEPYALPKLQKKQPSADLPAADRPSTTDSRAGVPSVFLQETTQITSTELAAEAALHTRESQQLKTRNAELLTKLHNIRRRERRKQQAVAEQRKLIKSLRKALRKTAHKTTSLYSKQYYYKSNYNRAKQLSCEFCEEQIGANQQLKQTIIELQEIIAELQEIQPVDNTIIFSKTANVLMHFVCV